MCKIQKGVLPGLMRKCQLRQMSQEAVEKLLQESENRLSHGASTRWRESPRLADTEHVRITQPVSTAGQSKED